MVRRVGPGRAEGSAGGQVGGLACGEAANKVEAARPTEPKSAHAASLLVLPAASTRPATPRRGEATPRRAESSRRTATPRGTTSRTAAASQESATPRGSSSRKSATPRGPNSRRLGKLRKAPDLLSSLTLRPKRMAHHAHLFIGVAIPSVRNLAFGSFSFQRDSFHIFWMEKFFGGIIFF